MTTTIGTPEYFAQQIERWHGDGTFAYPCRRRNPGRAYRIHAFGRWWLVSKRPTARHKHRVPASMRLRASYRWWIDDATRGNSKPMTRKRMACLLRAARSRGETIHVIHHIYHRSYVIGRLHIDGRA